MSADSLVQRLRKAVEALPQGLREHVLEVEAEAVRLARLHGLDAERLRIAALGHDIARAQSDDRLLALARSHGVPADEVERASPILLHGPIGARLLEGEYGYGDPEVLAAVAAHTTARPGMSALEKALFIADKIEQEKVSRKPALAAVRALAESDLDAAMLRFLDLHLIEAVERRWQVHPRTVAARNELLARTPRPPA
ncbi:MAG TPA: bis(5'-nucleosyl)-tetraphosphatase (symmetrical) YqeK [Dehalococcoidia bacterium]|nr:bis(5'-nucleosyl)-tetraphosphatase (symmetrical) YqeK [Dehalococcoidia bacterium]